MTDKLEDAIKIINTCIQEAATSNNAFTKLKVLNARMSNQLDDCFGLIADYMDAISEAEAYASLDGHHWEEHDDTPDSIPCNQLNGEW